MEEEEPQPGPCARVDHHAVPQRHDRARAEHQAPVLSRRSAAAGLTSPRATASSSVRVSSSPPTGPAAAGGAVGSAATTAAAAACAARALMLGNLNRSATVSSYPGAAEERTDVSRSCSVIIAIDDPPASKNPVSNPHGPPSTPSHTDAMA